MSVSEETHPGDGLYASHDGHQVRLRAPREGGDHEAYLTPEVLREFVQWCGREGIDLRRFLK